MMRHLDHVFNSSQALRWEGKNRLDTKENGAPKAQQSTCSVFSKVFIPFIMF